MNGTPGATQSTIDELRALGVFAAEPDTVLEIGPGSGRYLEKTLKECSPGRYEIYETAAPWADYLVDTFGVVAQPTAGCSLAPTPDGSIDLVQAHKVFNTLTFLGAARYFFEMARVTRPGGRIVFDVMTETCLDPATMRAWAARGTTPTRPPCLAGHAWTSSRPSAAAWRPASSLPWASPSLRCLSSGRRLDPQNASASRAWAGVIQQRS
ncbi:methyltransferase domain-containing protein [Streptomyces sp. DT190]|uniref:methyltransferase domain-containing protein n=1 Tax=unclassified Streptomyces TaxID=2593676 RepID=UPI003CEDB05D